MTISLGFHRWRMTSGQNDVQSSPFVPIVYDNTPALPLRWEYHTLRVDIREAAPLEDVELNELGNKGWLLVGVLHADEGRFVYYYFVRQKSE